MCVAACVQELGIPTANVASEALRVALAEAVTGIYAGWCTVGADPQPHKMVMSIGYNPFYGGWLCASLATPSAVSMSLAYASDQPHKMVMSIGYITLSMVGGCELLAVNRSD